MWNILIGLIFVIGGLSGKLVLRGTNSSGALAVIGIGLLVWGIFQMVNKARAKETSEEAQEIPGAQE